MTRRERRYDLLVQWPLAFGEKSSIVKKSRKVEEALGRDCEASGGGLGIRDMEWSDMSWDEATAAAERVLKLNFWTTVTLSRHAEGRGTKE